MFWIVYFSIYVFLGVRVDNDTNSLPYRLLMALLLVWPLFVVLALGEIIRELE